MVLSSLPQSHPLAASDTDSSFRLSAEVGVCSGPIFKPNLNWPPAHSPHPERAESFSILVPTFPPKPDPAAASCSWGWCSGHCVQQWLHPLTRPLLRWVCAAEREGDAVTPRHPRSTARAAQEGGGGWQEHAVTVVPIPGAK